MTEELLAEARAIEAHARYKKLNRKLIIGIVVSTVVFALSNIFMPMDIMSPDIWDRVEMSIGGAFGFILLSAILALLIAIIPMKKWAYGKRYLRTFLITALLFMSFFGISYFFFGVMSIYRLGGF
ncbi:MAG: hypothetical protein AB8F95_10095 [Bacteroidia bacterium]